MDGMDPFIKGDRAMTKYVVFVNVFNQNADESVTFEESFDSLKDVTKYVSHFSCSRNYSGHVEKWTKDPNDECFTSELIMNF
jgi:hypothetical protein